MAAGLVAFLACRVPPACVRPTVAVLVGLLIAGCAATDQPCRSGRTGGWFSGWGSSGANAFTVGLRRTWGNCDDRTTGPARRPLDAGPVPSADPGSEQPTLPSSSNPPR
jgi:hypothetical protein